VAEALAAAGYRVLVSTATDIPLFVGSHPGIEHRQGRLSEAEMGALIRERGIEALVDATHPYATQVRSTAARVADASGIPYLTLIRPGLATAREGVCFAGDHEEASRIACESGKPVLLTIGSRNVRPYAEAARQAGIPLVARVLDHPDSHQACREARIPETHVITGRGPFSINENRRLIRQFGIGVLVTKDSGDAGGVSEKLEAARLEGCLAIVVGRPDSVRHGGFERVVELVKALQERLASTRSGTMLAMDLESVLVPEIWETVACVAGVPELAMTTRDIGDYDTLMRHRIALCREHGLTLSRLREIVATIKPFPGAVEFFAWAQSRALVVIVSDTFHELAGPVVSKLGSPLMICNSLAIDEHGYMSGFEFHSPGGKAGIVTRFQRLGFQVLAVGDSFNDLAMLQTAHSGFLFRPAPRVLEKGFALPDFWEFNELQTALAVLL